MPRVIPLLEPARRTSGEVMKLRDDDGKITRTVHVRAEQRYTTIDLITTENELVERAEARQHENAIVVPDPLIDQTLAEFPGLDQWQAAMVRQILGCGHGVDVVIGKAGAGKSYACQAVVRGLELAGIPVIGCAPTAQAASELRKAAGIETCTLDRLLSDVEHGNQQIPSGAVILCDEAGMVSTRNRLALQRLADQARAKVAQIGDHRQIPSVDVGGSHGVLAEQLGATTLDGNWRFQGVHGMQLREAAELIRDGQAPKGIALLRSLRMVYEHLDPAQVHTQLLADWQTLRAQGREVAITAFENSTTDALNQLARRHLINSGEIAPKGRSYHHPTTHEAIVLAAGDRIRLDQNYGDLAQPDGHSVAVYNGMRGTITTTTRRGVELRLDLDHTLPNGRDTITLPPGTPARTSTTPTPPQWIRPKAPPWTTPSSPSPPTPPTNGPTSPSHAAATPTVSTHMPTPNGNRPSPNPASTPSPHTKNPTPTASQRSTLASSPATALNRPGFCGGSNPWKGWGHVSQEVSG